MCIYNNNENSGGVWKHSIFYYAVMNYDDHLIGNTMSIFYNISTCETLKPIKYRYKIQRSNHNKFI